MNPKNLFLNSVVKFILLLLLFSLSHVSCENGDKGDAEVEEVKIQKDNFYYPDCSLLNYLVACSKGSPVCGSKPGEYRLKVFCIDENNVILTEGVAFCAEKTTNNPASNDPICRFDKPDNQSQSPTVTDESADAAGPDPAKAPAPAEPDPAM